MKRTPHLALTVQYAVRDRASLKKRLPRGTLLRWVRSALSTPAVLTLRFVEQEEGLQLNLAYRRRNKATNVLTFVYTQRSDARIMSDIVLCCSVIEREAAEQHKTLDAHYAHLIIHGVLHAQGYSHEDPDEAHIMETLETQRLAELGFADPYQERD